MATTTTLPTYQAIPRDRAERKRFFRDLKARVKAHDGLQADARRRYKAKYGKLPQSGFVSAVIRGDETSAPVLKCVFQELAEREGQSQRAS